MNDRVATEGSALLVEDDEQLASLVVEYLTSRGMTVTHVSDGHAAIREATTGRHEVVLLDLMLPGCDGLDVCRAVRSDSDVPIIMLTARGEVADRVVGLELGADDYLTKPFAPAELVARIRAVLRRKRARGAAAGVLQVGSIELDVRRRRVRRHGKELELTHRELDLLRVLMERPGIVLRRDELVERLHGSVDEAFGRSIDVGIHRLRQKLGDAQGTLVQTVRGVGYLLSPGSS